MIECARVARWQFWIVTWFSRCGAVRNLWTKWAGVVARLPFWIVTWSPIVARCEFCAQSGWRCGTVPFWIVTWSLVGRGANFVSKVGCAPYKGICTSQVWSGRVVGGGLRIVGGLAGLQVGVPYTPWWWYTLNTGVVHLKHRVVVHLKHWYGSP